MLVLLMMLADDPSAMVATARSLLAEPRCESTNTTDVTVCGLRRADRYRVVFLEHDPGDPAHESVEAERDRLLHRTNPVQELSPFLVGGGMAGVSMTTNLGSGRTEVRPPAP